jgi:hypothetical protein
VRRRRTLARPGNSAAVTPRAVETAGGPSSLTTIPEENEWYRLNLVSNALLRLIEIAGLGCEDGIPAAETLEVGSRLDQNNLLASFALALLGGLFATKVVSAPIPERPYNSRRRNRPGNSSASRHID